MAPLTKDRSTDSGAERASSGRAKWILLALVCTVALLGLGPVYDTDDDLGMISLLSGYFRGRSFDAVFLSHALSAALIRLYRAFPRLPWYGLLLETCNGLSAALWMGLIVACLRRTVDRLAAGAALLTGYGYLLLRLNFMAVALSLFFAGLTWLWKLQIERRPVRWFHALPGLAPALAHFIRPGLWILMVFFALPLLAVSCHRRNLRRLALAVLPAAALMIWTWNSHRAFWAAPAQRAYFAFNWARTSLHDVPHICTPAARDAAGWSEADYRMAMRQWLHDEQIFATDRIHRFLAHAAKARTLARYARTARLYLFSRYHLLCLVTLGCCLAALGPAALGRARPGPARRTVIWGWLLAGVFGLLVTRLPPRAFVPLYIHLGVLSAVLPPFRVAPRTPGPAARAVRGTALAVIVLGAATATGFWLRDARAGLQRREARYDELVSALGPLGEDLVPAGLGYLYESRYTPVFEPAARRHAVCLLPRGWMLRSPAYYHYLRSAGAGTGREMVRSLIGNPRAIWIVPREHRAGTDDLLAHLNEHYADGGVLRAEPDPRVPASESYRFFRITRAPADAADGFGKESTDLAAGRPIR